MDAILARLLEDPAFAAIVLWLLRGLLGLGLALALVVALFVLVRVVRNAKDLALAKWPSFSEISVVSQLLGVTLKQDAKRDEQLSALDTRLVEVRDKFDALDTKVAAMERRLPGGSGE